MIKLANQNSQTDPQSPNNNPSHALAAPNPTEAGLAAPEQSAGGLAAPKRSEGGRKIRRDGRIASLPKLQRDMVNHMLWNAVPYKNIVAALDEAGFTVTERNISNWATGGYLEWSLAQEHVPENRLHQDHMVDFLRRGDAQKLPQVGLQAPAPRPSPILPPKP